MTRDELLEVDLHLDTTIDLALSGDMPEDYLQSAKILIGSAAAAIASHSGQAIRARMQAVQVKVFAVRDTIEFSQLDDLKDALGYIRGKFSDMVHQGQFVGQDMRAIFTQAARHYGT